MEYRQARIGRIFVATVEHGEDLLNELKDLVKKEGVKTGIFYSIGALKEASMVRGPREPSVPPEPCWYTFNDGRELLALGTVFWDADKEEPLFHVHGVAGREQDHSLGCLRGQAEVYLTVEVILFELEGLEASRTLDPSTGLKLLRFSTKL